MKILSELDINKLIDNNRLILFKKNIVYDVTDFNNHPGGYEIFIKKNNTDISKDFNFHKNKKFFKKYVIGLRKKEPNCNCIMS